MAEMGNRDGSPGPRGGALGNRPGGPGGAAGLPGAAPGPAARVEGAGRQATVRAVTGMLTGRDGDLDVSALDMASTRSGTGPTANFNNAAGANVTITRVQANSMAALLIANERLNNPTAGFATVRDQSESRMGEVFNTIRDGAPPNTAAAVTALQNEYFMREAARGGAGAAPAGTTLTDAQLRATGLTDANITAMRAQATTNVANIDAAIALLPAGAQRTAMQTPEARQALIRAAAENPTLMTNLNNAGTDDEKRAALNAIKAKIPAQQRRTLRIASLDIPAGDAGLLASLQMTNDQPAFMNADGSGRANTATTIDPTTRQNTV